MTSLLLLPALALGLLGAHFYRAAAWPLAEVLPWLAVGPLAGLWMMRPLLMKRSV